MASTEKYFKYHAISAKDISWGLYVTDVGYSKVKPGENYPANKNHPLGYHFEWDRGRVLQEYQLIFISDGEGVFESAVAGKKKISPGSVIILFPGEWHRYRPQVKTGWTEYWVGFKGQLTPTFFQLEFFRKDNPVMHPADVEPMMVVFQQILQFSEQEQPGYQQIVSGLVLQLLGYMVSANQIRLFEGKEIQHKINLARMMMRESLHNPVKMEDIASRLNMGYTWFRRMFRQYTGITPLQYLLQLRIQLACEMLLSERKTVKEIAFELNFETPFYFSRLFKEKTGFSPMEYKRAILMEKRESSNSSV